MQLGPEDRLALIRRYYRAYENDDQQAIEALLHEGFTFTSPEDDHINRAEYLQRCWPGHERIRSFNLLDACAEDKSALIRYEADVRDGPGFSCVEYFEFTDDRVSHVDVYFGRAPTRD